MIHRGAVLGAIVAAAASLLAPAPARAQAICANFWAQQSGTYGDLAGVTVTGVPVTPPAQATQDTVTGFVVPAGGSFVYAYDSTSQVARWDLQVVDVDPGEEVQIDVDGAMLAILPEHLVRNPDVTMQPLMVVGGRLASAGADGSAYLEIYGIGATQLRVAATGGAVIVFAITNAFCQCANGNKHFNEDCDDGGTVPGDGCDATCAVEPGWTCTGNPSACTLGVCGDGGLSGVEQCDDGGTADGDGCSMTCAVEPGWACTGTPSACVQICGNAALDPGETCDDGGQIDGDGCDAGCREEMGWMCSGTGPGSCVEEPDADDDTIPDGDDVCPTVYDPSQADGDGDGVGDECDNCIGVANPDQANTGGDTPGDACEDADGDGVVDLVDVCPADADPAQADADGDGVGDACDDGGGDGDGGGCCGAGRARGTGSALLALVVLGVLGVPRRRRRA